MKFGKIFTLFWLFSLAQLTGFAQLSDNFGDGNFTANPVWVGDTDKFTVEAGVLRLNDTAEGQSYLATQSTMALDVQWDFWVRLAFSPSNSNHPRIYLLSDQQNLRGSLNGYFIQIGRDGTDNKRIFLMRQNGPATGASTLLTGSQNLATASNNIIRIRVTRTAAGRFDVWADGAGGNLFLPQGSVTDNTFNNSGWFGIVCNYTISNIRNFYFDDFAIGPIIQDTAPPVVNLVEVVSANQINVHFSEVVDLATSQTTTNYHVNHGIGSPLTASRNISRPNIVNLFFATPLRENFHYEFSIRQVMDHARNVMSPFTANISLYSARRFDIVFNEIMANPSPAVALPPHEYIELYNTTEFDINLNGWVLQHGTTSRTLPMAILPAKGYMILTHEAAVPSFRPFGHVVGVPGLSTTALTNAGTSLLLYAPGAKLVSYVSYSDRWYRNPAKMNGGWSLEKIDPLNLCQGAENWRASEHTSGGTPGIANSILRNNPDNTRPDLLRVGFVNPTTLRLFFSEPMDEASLVALAQAGDFGVGNVALSQALLPDFSVAEITLAAPLETGRIFELVLPTQVSDCAGNPINNRSARVAVPQPAQPLDVVINEVLFNPPDFGSRYIELFNRSERVIELRDYVISSKDTIQGFLTSIRDISAQSLLLFPGDYLVLTSDPEAVRATFMTSAPNSAFVLIPSMPSMTNTSGVLVLASKGMVEIDLFAYHESMHFALLTTLKGVALERINPNWPTQDRSNWHSAAQSFGFGTPGFQNSQYLPHRLVQEGTIELYPEVFSPDGDGHYDFLTINYRFDEPGYIATVRVFDNRGRLIRNLVGAELLAVNGSITWDGTTDDRQKAPIGIYIVHLEITALNGRVLQYRKTAVVGGRL